MHHNNCEHKNLVPEVCDQTLGILCTDCNTLLGYCWMDEHVSEKLWNQACRAWPDAKPCAEDRDDVCFLCGERFTPASSA